MSPNSLIATIIIFIQYVLTLVDYLLTRNPFDYIRVRIYLGDAEEFGLAEESVLDYYDIESDDSPEISVTESDYSPDSDYIPDSSATESDDSPDSDSDDSPDSDSDYIPDSPDSDSDYSEPVPVEICIGVLRNGSPCRFAAKHGDRCGHHKLRGDSTRGSLLCVGVLRNGSPCRFAAKHGDLCGHHKLRSNSTSVSLLSLIPNAETIYKNCILPGFSFYPSTATGFSIRRRLGRVRNRRPYIDTLSFLSP